MVLAGCAAQSTSNQTGSIEVRVTDAPPNQDVTSVMVTVTSVQIHLAGNSASPTTTQSSTSTTTTTATSTSTITTTDSDSGWITLNLSGPSTFDLLKVQGLEQVLAVGDLAPGQYTQIRMAVSKIQVAISGGSLQEATIPSGDLKFV
jgi:glycine cleavage system aminomethyltransferase T